MYDEEMSDENFTIIIQIPQQIATLLQHHKYPMMTVFSYLDYCDKVCLILKHINKRFHDIET